MLPIICYQDQDTLIYDINAGENTNHNDLNAFHDCFILVDNSYEGDYHNEVQLRSALENEIKNMGKDKFLLGTDQKANDEDDMSGQYLHSIRDLREQITLIMYLAIAYQIINAPVIYSCNTVQIKLSTDIYYQFIK